MSKAKIKLKTDSKLFLITPPAPQPVEIYPHDAPKTMTYVDSVKWCKKLSKETGQEWVIPTREMLFLMYDRKNEIGGFCTEPRGGSGNPRWYWSCTEHRENSSHVYDVRFSDANVGWDHKDFLRLSCRPVRLVPVASSG